MDLISSHGMADQATFREVPVGGATRPDDSAKVAQWAAHPAARDELLGMEGPAVSCRLDRPRTRKAFGFQRFSSWEWQSSEAGPGRRAPEADTALRRARGRQNLCKIPYAKYPESTFQALRRISHLR